MRRLPVYILTLILIIACGGENEKKTYTIQGKGIETGTVYLFGTGDTHKQLSSKNCDGEFSISIPLESKAILTLILPNEKTLPLFAEPGTTAKLQADSILNSGWAVMGGKTQLLHDSISRVLDATDDFAKQKKTIEEFIKENPSSEVAVELFRRYLVEIPAPDNEYIKKTIKKLGGTIMDHEYFTNLTLLLDKKPGNAKNKTMPSFKYTTLSNEKINQATFGGKHLLITFWTTWNDNSLEHLKRLENVKEGVKGESFEILNIALESDTALVRQFVEEKQIIGHNACDTKGMNSDVISSLNIASLPFSALVTPYKRIAEYNLKLDSTDIALIDSLVLKHDKKQKK